MFEKEKQEAREKEDIERMLKFGRKKSEICKALGFRADALNEKIKKYKLRG